MVESHKHHEDTTAAPRLTLAEEIANYQLHFRLTDHIFAYYTQLGTLANLFMIATGAVWLVLVPRLQRLARIRVPEQD